MFSVPDELKLNASIPACTVWERRATPLTALFGGNGGGGSPHYSSAKYLMVRTI